MLRLVVLILPLSLDTFAVAAAIGAAGVAPSRRLRLSLIVAAVQGAMPLLGVGLGAGAGRLVGGYSDLVAAIVLAAVGVYMLRDDQNAIAGAAGARGVALIAICLSVSIDELAIGVSAGLLRLPILIACLAIAIQGFAAAQIGMRLGGRIAAGIRERAEQLAGIALIAIAGALLAARAGLV